MKQQQRMRDSIFLAYKIATAIATVVFVILMVFPKQLIMIFTNDPAAIEMATETDYAWLSQNIPAPENIHARRQK